MREPLVAMAAADLGRRGHGTILHVERKALQGRYRRRRGSAPEGCGQNGGNGGLAASLKCRDPVHGLEQLRRHPRCTELSESRGVSQTLAAFCRRWWIAQGRLADTQSFLRRFVWKRKWTLYLDEKRKRASSNVNVT